MRPWVWAKWCRRAEPCWSRAAGCHWADWAVWLACWRPVVGEGGGGVEAGQGVAPVGFGGGGVLAGEPVQVVAEGAAGTGGGVCPAVRAA